MKSSRTKLTRQSVHFRCVDVGNLQDDFRAIFQDTSEPHRTSKDRDCSRIEKSLFSEFEELGVQKKSGLMLQRGRMARQHFEQDEYCETSTLILRRLSHMGQSHGRKLYIRELMNKGIEALWLQKQESVRSDNSISHVAFQRAYDLQKPFCRRGLDQ